jgi:hypothetical protein
MIFKCLIEYQQQPFRHYLDVVCIEQSITKMHPFAHTCTFKMAVAEHIKETEICSVKGQKLLGGVQAWHSMRGSRRTSSGGRWGADRRMAGKETYVPDNTSTVGFAADVYLYVFGRTMVYEFVPVGAADLHAGAARVTARDRNTCLQSSGRHTLGQI